VQLEATNYMKAILEDVHGKHFRNLHGPVFRSMEFTFGDVDVSNILAIIFD
jgi:hypothetical protein